MSAGYRDQFRVAGYPSHLESSNPNTFGAQSVSSMNITDASSGLAYGGIDYFPFMGRCTSPNGVLSGRAWIQLRDTSNNKRITAADRPMRTYFGAPWMTFNILPKCDGKDETGKEIDMGGFRWQILVLSPVGAGCRRQFDIRRRSSDLSDTAPYKTIATGTVEQILSPDFDSTTTIFSAADDDKPIFTLKYDFKGDEGEGDPVIFIENVRPNLVPQWVAVYTAAAYQANLVELSISNGRPYMRYKQAKVPSECGGTFWGS